MADLFPNDKPLPSFRRDLELYRGPDDTDGSPTFNLFDPVAVRYYKISWAESLILQMVRQNMTAEMLCKEIEAHSTLRVAPEEIQGFYTDALRHNLLAWGRPSESLEKEAAAKEVGWMRWLALHYLYFRVPLWAPDKFLTNTIGYVAPFFSWIALCFYALIGIAGISFLFTRFDEYLHTFTYFFSLKGLIGYASAIIFVKIVHEMSHAYTAKRMGIHVPTMGFALVVLWPVLYTDVTDGWKLRDRNKRMAISAAGILAELLLASLATIGWAWSDPGLLQSIFFIVSSVTWVSTLVINLNPAVRFDGYYILCDLWGVDNLQGRSFAYARWAGHKYLLGIDNPPPEEVSSSLARGFILYSLYTCIYRFFLYISIAVFVYYKFTKALGIFLFFLEITLFMAWPLVAEVAIVNKLRDRIRFNKRMGAMIAVGLLFVGWIVLPLPHTVHFTAITAPVEEQIIYTPDSGRTDELFVAKNDQVRINQPLVAMSSPELDAQITSGEWDRRQIKKQIDIAGRDEAARPYIAQKSAELAKVEEELVGLLAKRHALDIKAEVAGELFAWDETVRPGLYLPKDHVIGKIANTKELKVVSFVPESDFSLIHEGDTVTFVVGSTLATLQGTISKINPTRTSQLTYPQLASIHSGTLPVADAYFQGSGDLDKRKEYHTQLVDSYYEVTATFSAEELEKHPQLRFGTVGWLETDNVWSSYLVSGIRHVVSVILRESAL